MKRLAVVLLRRNVCGLQLSGPQDWSCGYRMFADSNGNGNQDANEPDLKAVEVSTNVRLQHLAGGTDRVQMNPWGKATGGAHRFLLAPATGSTHLSGTVCLNLGGQIQLLKGNVACP